MTPPTTDAELQREVLHQLAHDVRVATAPITVGVDRGLVTLTGTVDTWAQVRAAQEVAYRVPAVLDLANDLAVRVDAGVPRNDGDLARTVRQALAAEPRLPAAAIRVAVSDGGVTLVGTVQFPQQRAEAAHAIAHLPGVRWVVNELVVPGPELAAGAVRAAITAALAEHAARAADRLQVEIHDGHVTLSGVVQSWTERAVIVDAASATPGVVALTDHLRVEA